MSTIYILSGYKKMWLTAIIYGILASVIGLIIYFSYEELYELDLIALGIPYLVLVPLDLSTRYLLKHYVLTDDNYQANEFVAVYNRVSNILWLIISVLSFGIILSVIDILQSGLKAENIWSISISMLVIISLLVIDFKIRYKKQFSYIIITRDLKVYRFVTKKSRLKTKKIFGENIFIYPRGIYQDDEEIVYLYYMDIDFSLENTSFKPYQSELFEYIKSGITSHELLEEKYTEFIEKSSII